MAGPPTRAHDQDDRHVLRAAFRERRDRFVREGGAPFSIAPALSELLVAAGCVGSYSAMGSEVDPGVVTSSLPALGLPRIDRIMTFHRWTEGDQLERARLNFRQPLATAIEVTPDLVLTPLIAFDRAGNRIGQGAGCYDRYFAHNEKALRIGLAWSLQEAAAVDIQPWDMPLDAIATEAEWIIPLKSRLQS